MASWHHGIMPAYMDMDIGACGCGMRGLRDNMIPPGGVTPSLYLCNV
jgi:hypothetical protein